MAVLLECDLAVYHPDRVLNTHHHRNRHLPSLCIYQLDDTRIRFGGCWWRTAMGNHHGGNVYESMRLTTTIWVTQQLWPGC